MIAFLAFSPLALAPAAYFLSRRSEKARDYVLFVYFCAMAACAAVLTVRVQRADAALSLPFLAGGLTFRADGFRALYALVACVMWLVSFLLSGEYFAHYKDRGRYFLFTLLTMSGTTGLFLSDDLMTTFVFFEIMSVSSYAWVAHDEKPLSLAAGRTYLALSVFGGMVTLMGLMLLQRETGSLAFSALEKCERTRAVYTASALALVGFATKAGVFPLHVWLPKAHPVAPAPASALLSGVLTKTGVFGLLVVSCRLYRGVPAAGNVLLAFGLATLLIGAVLALFSVDLKRTLACSSMSQIGYILTGIAASALLGEEGGLALTGVVSHMLNHSMFKLLLFGCAGVIYMNAHTLDLNRLRGFGRGKPYLAACFAVGAWGIACLPGLSGYVGKTMLHEGIAECAHISAWYKAAEWAFLAGAGITTAYMLKLFFIIFIEKNADGALQDRYAAMNGRYARLPSLAALAVPAVWIVAGGVLPDSVLVGTAKSCLSFLCAQGAHYPRFYAAHTLLDGMISPAIGLAVYLTAVRYALTKDGEVKDPLRGRKTLEEAFVTNGAVLAACRAFTALCAALDGVLASAPLRAAGRACTRAAELLDGALSGKLLPRLGDIATAPMRLADELSDEAVLLLRALFFRSRRGGAPPARSTITRASDSLAAKARRALDRLPRLRRRDAEDLTYGTRLTNAVSFGLLIGAAGILFAILYVLAASR